MIALLLSPLGKWIGAAALIVALIAGGKIWLVRHDAAVKAELVAVYEAKVAAAVAAETQRQALAASASLKAANDRIAAAKASEAKANAQREQDITEYEAKLKTAQRACLFDDGDVDFFMRHH